MNDDKEDVPDLVGRACDLVLLGEHDAARSVLGSIDYEWMVSSRRAALRSRRGLLTRQKVWQQPRQYGQTVSRSAARIQSRTDVPAAIRLATFERDHFTCRYSHCKKRTIYPPVLRALSALFPDIIPYQKNWRPLREHIIYWTYSTSLEHRISFPHGGTSNPENLITACYLCNDIKNMIRASDLGWEVGTIQDEDWDGLKSYLPRLSEAVGHIGPERTSGTKAPGGSRRPIVENSEETVSRLRLGSLVRAVLPGKKTTRNYRVDRLDGNQAVLYEMWRRTSDRVWVQSKRSHIIEVSELKGAFQVLRIAPVPGNVDKVTTEGWDES